MNWSSRSVYLCLVILITSLSCATLNRDEIKDLNRTAFAPPELIPGYETNNLRIDVLRQTLIENINDSVTETKDKPYHPMGLDLGNGLFFDLNENLCLKLEYLLGFSGDKNFEIHQTYRASRKRGTTVYRYFNDTLKVNYLYGRKLHYRYHRVSIPDGFCMMHKKRQVYSIALTDTGAIYTKKMSNPRVIQKADQDGYDLRIRKRTDHFRKTGSDVFLKKDYVVSLANDKLSLEIKNPHRKKNNVIATIVKDDQKLFIYNRHYSGIKIETGKDSILVYRNNALWSEYELIK